MLRILAGLVAAALTMIAVPAGARPHNPAKLGERLEPPVASRCIPPAIAAALRELRGHGRVRITSTCRSKARNRRSGGAKRSYHLRGQAVDFRLTGNVRAAAAHLRVAWRGGFKYYGRGRFHLDTGPRRTW